MKTGKLVISTVVVAVIMFVTDWLWYTQLMVNYFTPMPNARPEHPDFMWLILGVLIFSFAFVYIYSKGVGTGTPFGEGARYGFWVALLAWVSMGFAWYGLTSTAPLTEYLVDMVYRLVQMVVMGVVAAYLTGMPANKGQSATGSNN